MPGQLQHPRFTRQIEELGRKVVDILKKNGPFVVHHLRHEMDVLAFSGCKHGCNNTEVEELTKMRYNYPWWKEKIIDSEMKRREGQCPLTPKETALILRALGMSSDVQIYIAAGQIYGREKKMLSKETLLDSSELILIQNHSSQMAALDYLVSLESDVFVPTYDTGIWLRLSKDIEGSWVTRRRFRWIGGCLLS